MNRRRNLIKLLRKAVKVAVAAAEKRKRGNFGRLVLSSFGLLLAGYAAQRSPLHKFDYACG